MGSRDEPDEELRQKQAELEAAQEEVTDLRTELDQTNQGCDLVSDPRLPPQSAFGQPAQSASAT